MGRIEAALARLWWRESLAPLAWVLWPLSLVFRALAALRRVAYAVGLLRAQRLPVPVIVVGNLVAGGAGKTPTVIALVHVLRRAGYRPGVISRGHGRRGDDVAEVDAGSAAAGVGDEPLLIRRRTGVPVWVARQRIAAARALCAAHAEVDVLVADDGLQHLALARDVQVIVFDERGIGNGALLPAGPLRQKLPAYVPVNSQVLYNAPRPSTHWPGALAQRKLAGAVRLRDWWRGAPPQPHLLDDLRGCEPLVAVAGMAAPQRFFDMLRDAGLRFTPMALGDHFAYDTLHLPWPPGTRDVVLTEKDAVKLDVAADGTTRIWVVALDFALPDDFSAAVLDNLRRVQRR